MYRWKIIYPIITLTLLFSSIRLSLAQPEVDPVVDPELVKPPLEETKQPTEALEILVDTQPKQVVDKKMQELEQSIPVERAEPVQDLPLTPEEIIPQDYRDPVQVTEDKLQEPLESIEDEISEPTTDLPQVSEEIIRQVPSESVAEEIIETGRELSLSEKLSKTISLDLRNMDIIDTIKFLAVQGDLNIVTTKSVGGRITLFLNNVTIGDMLDIILFTNNLALELKNNIMTIMTEEEHIAIHGKPYSDTRQMKTITVKYADPDNVLTALANIKSDIGKIIADSATGTLILIDTPGKLQEMGELAKEFDLPTVGRIIPTVEEVFELSYAKAVDIEPEISKSLTENIGSVSVNEQTNKIIVRDLAHNMNRIRELIRQFDSRTRQVLIGAQIVEITLSDDYTIGVDWQKIFRGIDNLTFTGDFSFSAPSSTSSSLAVSVGTLADDRYEATLEAIRYIGKVKIVSSPHIAVLNNQEAKFMVGSREAYVTSTVTTGEVTTSTSEAVEFIDVGVNVYVTPVINKDGFIKMHIKPEVSSVREWLETSEGNQIPIVDTSNVETEVLIKDGKTVVIAGLVKETTTKVINKIPLLGDIPLVGLMFRDKKDEKERKELMIFITPHIISEEEDLVYVEEFDKSRKTYRKDSIKDKKPRKPAKK